MGLFNLFNKDKRDYDATNVRVTDLNKGFVFDYNLATWRVEESYEYDWGDNYFTHEHKISDGINTLFLSVEDDDGLELSVSKKVKIRNLGEDIPEYIQDNEEPPNKIIFEGETYYMDSGSAGYIRTIGSGDWEELMSWDFYNKNEDKIVTIEQYDDNEFEASYGTLIKEFEISNILPAESK
jgi:hypothetical protein